MNILGLLDAPSAMIVLGGTGVATFLRCGAAGSRAALVAVARLGRRRFDAERVRAELSVQVREIQADGLLRSRRHRLGDSVLGEVTDALIGQRSVAALHSAYDANKARRLEAGSRATATLSQAAELARVFGLAGTLVSLSPLMGGGVAMGAWPGAISMPALSMLYGLLLANLVFAPLARMVHRVAEQEEVQRQQVVDWLASQVSRGISRSAFTRMDEAA